MDISDLKKNTEFTIFTMIKNKWKHKFHIFMEKMIERGIYL